MMDEIKIVSLDYFFIKKRAQMIQKSIILHSAFNQVTNYLYEGSLITIAAETIDNASHTIRLTSNDFKEIFRNPPKKLIFQENGLLCDSEKKLVWSDADMWSEPLLVYPQETDRLRHNIQIIKEKLKEKRMPVWAFPSKTQKKVKVTVETELEKLLYVETESLLSYIKSKHMGAQTISKEIRLFGLGRGLTPSGDDVMTGIIYAASMANFPINLQEEKEKWREESKRKTNIISYSAIFHASNGRGRELMNDFTKALLYAADDAHLLKKLELMLGIGSSSGSEIVWGIVRGLEATL